MSERVRDDDGQFVETISPAHVLAVMRAAETPVVTASDVADELDCTPEAVTSKLKQLQDHGRVDRRKVGARAVVWWPTERSSLDTDGEHDPTDPFFAAPPLDTDRGEAIDVADTDEILGEALGVDDDSTDPAGR